MIPDLVHHQCPSNVTMEEQRPSTRAVRWKNIGIRAGRVAETVSRREMEA